MFNKKLTQIPLAKHLGMFLVLGVFLFFIVTPNSNAQTCYDGASWEGPTANPPAVNRTKPIYTECYGEQDVWSNIDVDTTGDAVGDDVPGIKILHNAGTNDEPVLQAALSAGTLAGVFGENILIANTNSGATIMLVDTANNPEFQLQYGAAAANHWSIYVEQAGDSLRFWGGSDTLTLLTNGNVGIGVNDPDEELEVNGSIKMTDGNETDGYVMTTDANGVGSWADLDTLGAGNWTLSGTTLYPDDFANWDVAVGANSMVSSEQFLVDGLTFLFNGTSEDLRVGRDGDESISFEVQDVNAYVDYEQDSDSNANHNLYIRNNALGSGNNAIRFQTGGSDSLAIMDNGNVGIGIDPTDPLHVLSDSGGDAIHLEENSGGEDWQLGIDAAGDLNFEDEGTSRVTFEDGGNVGIGTANPGSLLHVRGDVEVDGGDTIMNLTSSEVLYVGSNTDDEYFWLDGDYDLTYRSGSTDRYTIYNLSTENNVNPPNEGFPIQFHGNTDFDDAINVDDQICLRGECVADWDNVSLYWTASGNDLYPISQQAIVGIGTNNPTGIFEAVRDTRTNTYMRFIDTDNGDLIVSGSNPSLYVRHDNNASQQIRMHHNGSNTYFDFYQGDAYWRNNGATTVLTLEDDNDIGVRTTSPRFELDVNGNFGVQEDVYMEDGYSIRVDDNSDTDLYIGNYDDGPFSWSGDTASLTVEGDVNAGQLCIQDSCRSTWTDIGGESGWTDDGTVVRLTTASDDVGVGHASPSAKLDVEDSVTGSTYVAEFRNTNSSTNIDKRTVFVDGADVVMTGGSPDSYGLYIQGGNASNSPANSHALYSRAGTAASGGLVFSATLARATTIQDESPNLLLLREDGGVGSGDWLGQIMFDDTDGGISTSDAPVVLRAYASESHGSGDKGGYFEVLTKPTNRNADQSAYQRLRIENNGVATFAEDIYLRDGDVDSGDYLVRIYDSSDDGRIDVYRNNSVVNRINGNGDSYFNGGQVGIGVTDPDADLEINGQIKITGGSPAANRVLTSDSAGLATWQDAGSVVGTSNAGSCSAGQWRRIASNSGNRADASFTLRDFISSGGHSTMRFHAGVNYGDANGISFTMMSHSIYNTSAVTFTQVRIIENGTYDGAYLEVYCNRSGNVEYTMTDNDQSSGWTAVDWTAGSVPGGWTAHTYDTNHLFKVAQDADDEAFWVSRDGAVHSQGYYTDSDERLKENIQDIGRPLDILSSIRGIYFNWRSDSERSVGVIAQEVEKVLPEVVRTGNNGYKSVEYSNIVPVLIEAIKDQQDEIDGLEERLKRLENLIY